MKATSRLATLAIALALCGACGCSTPGAVSGGDAVLAPESSAALLDRVGAGAAVSENDAFRGILMLLDGKDDSGAFAQRVEALGARKIVWRQWDFQADRPLTRGKLAYMVYQACGMKGGLTLALTGPSRRYCLRELVYRRMMSQGPDGNVTGMEFVGVMARADAWIQTGQVPAVLALREGQ